MNSEKSRWIPVDKRLPYKYVDVLVDDCVDMFVAWYDGNDWHSSDYKYKKNNPIIAWRDLPEPYYEECGCEDCKHYGNCSMFAQRESEENRE